MRITEGDLSSGPVVALLMEHLRGVAAHSPPESIHALDLNGLRSPGVSFFAVWNGTDLLACGALKELDSLHGEIKSMRTASAHLRKGAATRVLEHLIDVARKRGYERLSLETGSGPVFAPAHALYEKFGFMYCGPLADYRDDPFSRFMTLRLRSGDPDPPQRR